MLRRSFFGVAVCLAFAAHCGNINIVKAAAPEPAPAAVPVKRDGSVVVFGATGRTGQHIVKKAQAAGYTVRGFTRNAEKAMAAAPDMEWAAGDLRETATIAPAIKGADYVAFAVASNSMRDPANLPEEVEFNGLVAAVDAAKAEGVKHFALISSIGVTDKDNALNRIANNVLQWKFKAEEYLRASGLNYTIVRPGGLWDKPGGELGILVVQGDKIMQAMISREDVATVIVESLSLDAARNKTFEIFNIAAADINGWKKFLGEIPADR